MTQGFAVFSKTGRFLTSATPRTTQNVLLPRKTNWNFPLYFHVIIWTACLDLQQHTNVIIYRVCLSS